MSVKVVSKPSDLFETTIAKIRKMDDFITRVADLDLDVENDASRRYRSNRIIRAARELLEESKIDA